MIYLASAVRWILSAGSIVVFPIIVVNAYRRGGLGPLGRLAGANLAFIIVCALTLASRAFGNRRAPGVSYADAATNTVAVFLFMFGLPVIAASVTAIVLGNEKYPPWAVAAVAIGAAAAAHVIGILAGLSTLHALT